MRFSRLAAGTGVAAAVLLGGLLTATPASAATSCTGANYSPSSGIATANCTGNGQMRFRVTCNAIWPYESWTKYSSWLTVTNGGQSMGASFPSCAGPSSSVSVEYP